MLFKKIFVSGCEEVLTFDKKKRQSQIFLHFLKKNYTIGGAAQEDTVFLLF